MESPHNSQKQTYVCVCVCPSSYSHRDTAPKTWGFCAPRSLSSLGSHGDHKTPVVTVPVSLGNSARQPAC